jgi:hypothetical protein
LGNTEAYPVVNQGDNYGCEEKDGKHVDEGRPIIRTINAT